MVLKITRFILMVGIFLTFCFIASKALAKEDLGIFIFSCADFSDKEHWRNTMHHFDNYPVKRDQEGNRESVIPSSVGKHYFSPGPNEKLFKFFDSKFQGTKKIKEYILGGGGYQSDHIFFNVEKRFDFHWKSNEHNIIYITVPPGTAEKDMPSESRPSNVSAEDILKILNKLDRDGGMDKEGNLRVLLSPVKVKMTSTSTPTPTAIEEFTSHVMSIYKASNIPTPKPTVTTLRLIDSAKIITSLKFPKEKIKLLIIDTRIQSPDEPYNWVGKRYFICYANGVISNISKYPQDDWANPTFDQSFQVMGKNYVVLSMNTGVSDICAVFRIDPGAIVEVKRGERAYD